MFSIRCQRPLVTDLVDLLCLTFRFFNFFLHFVEQQFSEVARVIFPQQHTCHLSPTASSPTCQLLKQVTRGPWGLPVDPTLHRATDTTTVQLSEMVSLPVLIKHSVTAPLITQWVSEGEGDKSVCVFCVRKIITAFLAGRCWSQIQCCEKSSSKFS